MNQTAARYRKERTPGTDSTLTEIPEEDGAVIFEMSKQDRITTSWDWGKSTCRSEAKVCSILWGKRRDDWFRELDSGRHSPPVNDFIRDEIRTIFYRPPEEVALPRDFNKTEAGRRKERATRRERGRCASGEKA